MCGEFENQVLDCDGIFYGWGLIGDSKKAKILKKGNCATAFSRLKGFRGVCEEEVWCD